MKPQANSVPADSVLADGEKRARRAYSKPALLVYGDVREFTRGGGSKKEAKAAGPD